MVEDQQPDETAQADRDPATEEQAAERDDRQHAGDGGAHPDWADLNAYCEQLREEHETWSERLSALHSQLVHLQPALLTVAAQYRALAVEDDLAQLNQLVLGGAAMAQTVRLGYDLERYISLLWPAAADPRPSHARPESQGEYRVDILFHVGPDGRGRVRVEGEKRLEAPLPTSRERLRRVLLAAIQAPKYVGEDGEESAGAGASEQAAGDGTQPPADQEQRVSDEERTEVGTDEPVPEAEPRPGDPHETPPPEEQVIPLGPAAEGEAEEKPKRRARKS